MAVAHSIAAYHILKDDVPLPRPRPDYFTRRADPERLAQRLVAQLEPLGHTVTLQTATSTAEAVAAPPASTAAVMVEAHAVTTTRQLRPRLEPLQRPMEPGTLVASGSGALGPM